MERWRANQKARTLARNASAAGGVMSDSVILPPQIANIAVKTRGLVQTGRFGGNGSPDRARFVVIL
jgi:hypothetical protein